MTRRILLTLAATTAVVLIAFLVPLFVLVRDVAADRATNAALLVAQPLVPVVGTLEPDGIDAAATQASAAAERPVTVYLADGTVLGTGVERTTAVDLAATGRSFVEENDDGRSVLVPVAGRPEGTAVLRVDVPTNALRSGVLSASLALLGLALGLLAVALGVGALLSRSFLQPLHELTSVAARLQAGDLSARVEPAGPPELRSLGGSLNRLADRVRGLLQSERESVADLSHRLRTPSTALRLDAELIDDPDDRQRILTDVDALDRQIDEVIREARRPSAEPGVVGCDAVGVVHERVQFWSALADEQGRVVSIHLPQMSLRVVCGARELGEALDALLDNVFVHTPDGSRISVTVEPHDTTVDLVVEDAGPGFADSAVIERGVSGIGSTGLGLDVVRRTAEASGGSLSVNRSPLLGGASVLMRLGRLAS
ncbi:MAG: HAMP domain-containing sensor histidine kinase [Candidatus Nanopelagicales bacterium]